MRTTASGRWWRKKRSAREISSRKSGALARTRAPAPRGTERSAANQAEILPLSARQTPPIQLGTSGGNATDLANGYCCSGTLGALVAKGGTQYILSNSHVFAGDVVSGGNGRVAQIGDNVNQPGLVDINCNAANSQIVADVSTLSTTYPPGDPGYKLRL